MNAYRLAPGVSLNEIEGNTVLFSMKTGDSFGLNEPAALLLRTMLETGFEGAAEQCALLYEVERPEIERDLCQLVDELGTLGLLVTKR